MPSEIVFVEKVPESPNREMYEWPKVVAALKARPNEWARIYKGSSRTRGYSIARRISRGEIPEFRHEVGSFEAVARKSGDRVDIYARYVGGAA